MKKIAMALLCVASACAFAQDPPTTRDKVASMLNEAPPPATTLQAVVLSAKSGDTRMQALPGSFSTTYAFVTVLTFMDYPDQHASLRISDARPTLHLKIGSNPKGRVYLVKAESNQKTNNRSVKVGHSGFGSIGNLSVPDAKWQVPCTVSQEADGIWKIVPDADLAPGEYGLFVPSLAGGAQVPASGDLWDFGVDQG